MFFWVLVDAALLVEGGDALQQLAENGLGYACV